MVLRVARRFDLGASANEKGVPGALLHGGHAEVAPPDPPLEPERIAAMTSSQRTTERAEQAFRFAKSNSLAMPDPNGYETQYKMMMAAGMMHLSKAIRELYDKLEVIEAKLDTK
jgi:hypothetical protein